MNAHRPRKRFGQHFLTRDDVVADIVAAIAPQPGDILVEIGPGHGALTIPLSKQPIRLHAIEFDRDLAAALGTRFADSDVVTIHEGDALKFDYARLGSDLRIVGNLPYNISTPLLFHLMAARSAIDDMHFMLQKEVVERICAQPGSKSYGRLTIMLGCYLESVPLIDVPPAAFTPPPKVDSTVLRMRPRAEGEYSIDDHDALATVVAQAFSQRRKTLRNALRGFVTAELLAECGIDPGSRPEQLAIADWVNLSNQLPRQN